ncbi:MAG: hypothetical protein HOJ48_02630 [Desulfobacula sp.]|jgi:hypothetical protein|nr:hypothetical protein [Desulfobacula sp.]MBT7259667.1 hypothetical protein [Desulfobacula sp.]
MVEFNLDEGFDRLEKLVLGQCDRPPVLAQMHEFVLRQSGLKGREFYTNPEKHVRETLKVGQEFGLDIPDIAGFCDTYNIEAEALGATILYKDTSSPTKTLEPLIQNEKDIAQLKIPNPETDGRMQGAVDCLAVFKELTGRPTGHGCCAPLSLAVQLCGFQSIAINMMQNPGFVHRILWVLTEEVIGPYLQFVIKKQPDLLSICAADAMCSIPLLSEEMIMEFSVPYIVRLKEMCRGTILTTRNWVGDSKSKNLEGYWAKKLAVGSGILEVQDPDLNKIGIDRVTAYAEKRKLPLILGVGAEFLTSASIPEIQVRIKEYLLAGNDLKRRAIYLCNLDYNFSPEKLRATIAAINQYCKYGLAA